MNRKNSGTILISALLILAAFTIAVNNVSAATPPSLGAAGSYSILAGAKVTNIGLTTVTGNVGVSPSIGVPPHITGFPPGVIGPPGAAHDADANASAAQAADLTAFGFLDQTPTVSWSGTGVKDLTGLTLGPGVYAADAFTLSGTLTLSGSGVWIFKSASTLITSGTANVVGGDACDVWWRLVSSATLGSYTQLIGNILASTSISMATGASLEGRALAYTGSVTLDTNAISVAICTPITTVITSFTTSTSIITSYTTTISGTVTAIPTTIVTITAIVTSLTSFTGVVPPPIPVPGRPVGGVILSVDPLQLLAPYAVAILIAAAAIGLTVMYKRRIR